MQRSAKGAQHPPSFRPMSIVATVAHLSKHRDAGRSIDRLSCERASAGGANCGSFGVPSATGINHGGRVFGVGDANLNFPQVFGMFGNFNHHMACTTIRGEGTDKN